MRNKSGDDEHAARNTEEQHADDAADERSYETDDDRRRRVGEKYGTVHCGNGIRDDAGCNPFKRRDEIAENHADTGVNNRDSNSEFQPCHECEQEGRHAAGERADIRRSCCDGSKQVKEHHRNRGRDCRIPQESPLFRDLNIFRAVFRIADFGADPRRYIVGKTAKMPHGDAIPLCDAVRITLPNGRGDGTPCTKQKAA